MRASSTLLTCLVLAAALAGCVAEGEGVTKQTNTPAQTTSTGNTTASPSPTNTSEEPAAPVAVLNASVSNGSAPLAVSFSASNGEESAAITDWTLDFGDGNSTAGTTLPAEASHTYEDGGDFTAQLTINSPSGVSNASVTILVEGGGSAVAPPSETEFSGGPVLGCFTELGYEECPAWALGPGPGDAFGLWIELEPGHVGMSFTTASTVGDTDGWFFAEPDGAPLAVDVNNGGGEAGGVVPPDAKWLLVFPWVNPDVEITVTFTAA